ncbi:MAG: mechanosensitive ion channel [Desulfobacteraceae bacterium]
MLNRRFLCVIAVILLSFPCLILAEEEELPKEPTEKEPGISLSEDLGDAMVRQASQVREELGQKALSMFDREPLGWDWRTIDFIYKWLLTLPLKLPDLMRNVVEQSRLLGFVGSILMLTFLSALFYSIIGRRRVMARVEAKVEPFRPQIPDYIYPFILSAVRVVVAALIPLFLLAAFLLVNEMIVYTAPWFQLIGRLLRLYAIGSLLNGLLRETLTRDLFKVTQKHGTTIFQLTRLVMLYVISGVALVWGAGVFNIPSDVLALMQFVISLSIVVVLFLLHLNKKAMTSLLPQLPYRSYQSFLRIVQRYYFPIIFLALIAGILWCFGYSRLGSVVLVKIWSSGAVYVAMMLSYHILIGRLDQWYAKINVDDEAAQFLYSSVRSILLYITTIATLMIVFNLLGLLNPLQMVMSFPIFNLGKTGVTPWILMKAGLILFAFIFSSRLLQAFLEYKVYPAMGIEPGPAYALNTFFKYSSYGIGIIISLDMVGLNLQFLLVFAGAIGIGIGLGLQDIAANIISGFSLIFTGQLRKGDWIEVGDTMGVVTDIYLRATRVRSRDNIEYLIPNSDFTSGTLINYTLTSPLMRMELPVGVSYSTDPKEVSEIMVDIAIKEPLVSNQKKPVVRFVGYGDNSINFELLFWIDARATARRKVRSALYYSIFDALKEANIEIPFPQRDVYVRSKVMLSNYSDAEGK